MRATPNNAQNGLIALLLAVKLATFLSRHVLQVLIWTDGRKGDKSKKGGFNREVVSFGANGTMNNVRLREEGGRKRGGGTLRGGEVVVVWPLIYTSEDWGTRQHVDLRSTTVRPVHGSFRANGYQSGHRTRFACSTTSCWRCGPLYN